uniref:protein ALP1-like n=1 Tax=Ciona intestinalis TaxID=7719 RepID=UPI000EF55AB7|nr:protein ALP1-like [Ciona intestinalis]|eukprot:XP_018672036.2 protein ALP1-like [Ciona intestinalis]
MFTFVDIGDSGHHSDGGIYANSAISKFFEDGFNMPPPAKLPSSNAEVPYCIVGDNAFPLKPYLMRPFPDRGLSEDKRIFNYRLSRARRCIENAFGILAQRWRVLRSTIMANVETATQVVKATVVLHNWLQRKSLEKSVESRKYIGTYDVDYEVNGELIEGAWREEESAVLPNIRDQKFHHHHSLYARQIRELLKDYFNSSQGQVAWQYNKVTQGTTVE